MFHKRENEYVSDDIGFWWKIMKPLNIMLQSGPLRQFLCHQVFLVSLYVSKFLMVLKYYNYKEEKRNSKESSDFQPNIIKIWKGSMGAKENIS